MRNRIGSVFGAGALVVALASINAQADYWVQRQGDETISVRHIDDQKMQPGQRKLHGSLPFYLSEMESPSSEQLEEWLVSDQDPWVLEWQSSRVYTTDPAIEFVNSEVRTLVEQGPSANRINLTILGDGYTLAEKEKFFSDAQTMTDDLFTGSTFASYLPLFNVYAVFVPSQESGITDRIKKNTAFGLYRSPVGSKRGIMPGNSSALERALKLAPAVADYPVVIANDDYYGGLGGRYAITTRSAQSGAMVLRHELGHNFGNVGEEYDGGQVYSGANFSSSKNPYWSHWLNKPLEVFDVQQLSGDYVWKNLSTGSYRAVFDFPRSDARTQYQFVLRVSSVGWSTSDDVDILLNGSPIELLGHYTDDRSFFDLPVPMSLAPGRHVLEVREKIKDGDNVLAYAALYAEPTGTDRAMDRVAAYLNFNQSGRAVGYRPTHDSCLMRNMRVKHFCSVDLENMWIRFLAKVNLIDSLDRTGTEVRLATVPLPGLEIEWQRRGEKGDWVSVPEWKNKKQISGISPTDALQVSVEFKTTEVRRPSSRFKVVRTL